MPWLEGYTTIPRRGASSSRQQQQAEVLPYKDDSAEELVLPHFSTAESPPPTISPASATCRFVGEDSGSDDTPPKKKMKRTRLRSRSRAGKSVDVVKIKPLDVCTLILTSPFPPTFFFSPVLLDTVTCHYHLMLMFFFLFKKKHRSCWVRCVGLVDSLRKKDLASHHHER